MSGNQAPSACSQSRSQWRSPTVERIWRKHPGLKHLRRLLAEFRSVMADKRVHVLGILDDYRYLDVELVELLTEPVAELLGLYLSTMR